MDQAYLSAWLGRTEERADQISAAPVMAMTAMLDRPVALPAPGDALPPLWHWLYFLPQHRRSEIGHDGHPQRGSFLPPVPLPRRMWASGRVKWQRPLQVGASLTRVSSIVDVGPKNGRTGPLVFVLLRHEVCDAEGVLLTEEQDIVYRGNPPPQEFIARQVQAATDHHWIREIRPDPVLLFRYSALTFNAHRIHYDRPYTCEQQHYPGLVVHAPLVATLLVELLKTSLPDARIGSLSFRAVNPLFDTASFYVCGRVDADGRAASLWAKDAQGWLAMSARAMLA